MAAHLVDITVTVAQYEFPSCPGQKKTFKRTETSKMVSIDAILENIL